VAAHTLEGANERELAASWARYANAVLDRADQLAGQLATADRSDHPAFARPGDVPRSGVLGMLTTAPVDPAGVTRGLEIAVGLTDYWLGRHRQRGSTGWAG